MYCIHATNAKPKDAQQSTELNL